MKNQVQLIAYVDRLSSGGLQQLRAVLKGPLRDAFAGVHLLPFFHPFDGADAGFDPIDHTSVDPRLGDWDDLHALGTDFEIVADLIVNHISAQSPQFEDYLHNGEASPYAEMFLTFDRVFPQGAREADLLRIYRPRPGLPFTTIRLRNGEQRLAWTTFTPQQIDIDVLSHRGAAYLAGILERFRDAGVKLIRLDAIGYAVKKPGTSCFMIPETFAYISDLTRQAHAFGIEVLVEVHSYYRDQVEIARSVDRVYDFALPPLVLHTLFEKDSSALKEWLATSPRNCVTVLDTHDGIGVIDVGADARQPEGRPGLLSPAQIDALVEDIHRNSENQSRKATGEAASNLDLYQVNCTFYDALGRNDAEYLMARAIQLFAPGIPQVYYVGLLAGCNDMDLLARTGVGRDIGRHYYTPAEVEAALRRPAVQRLVELIRFRNRHPAFEGEFTMPSCPETELILTWRRGPDWATLSVDLARVCAVIGYSTQDGERFWNITEEAQ